MLNVNTNHIYQHQYSPSWRFKILEKIPEFSVFTCFSLKTMDFDVKHLKLLQLLVFGKAIGCPGCFLRSEG